MSASWKITLPCTKAEAEAIGDADMPDAVLLVTEEDEAAGRWRLDAYVEAEPDPATLAAIAALTPSAAVAPAVESLGDEDWVTMSQAGLAPIREGRFVVHTSAHPAEAPAGGRAFLIEAGQAFGTGHHETTAGCLAVLDGLAASRTFARVVDLGTGTGLLAFAAAHLWPEAAVMATDIDPVAVAVTAENAAANAVPAVALVVADGAQAPEIAAAAPFDLVIANILAGPLVAMAPEIAGIADAGAAIVLAGLLTTQAQTVVAAYAAQGCAEVARLERGDWTILHLTAPETRMAASPTAGDRAAWATDGA